MKNSRLESNIFYDLMHTSLCYTESNPYSRQNFADVCRKHMAEHIGRTTTQLTNPSWNHSLESLKHDGMVHLGPMITVAQIEDIQGYFLSDRSMTNITLSAATRLKGQLMKLMAPMGPLIWNRR